MDDADPTLDPLLDAMVVAEVRAGNRQAYGMLIDRHQVRLRAALAACLLDRDEVEASTHAAFVRAFAELERYDRTQPFLPWIRTIALDALRRAPEAHPTTTHHGADLLRRVLLDQALAPAPDGRGDALFDALDHGLAALPADAVALLADTYQSAHSIAELAARHRTSDRALKARLLHLRDRLGADGGRPPAGGHGMAADPDHLLAEVIDGDADAATRERLAALVDADAALRQRFLAQVAIAGALRARHLPAARRADLRRRVLAELGDASGAVRAERPATDRRPAHAPAHTRWWWRSTGIAAAVAGLLLLLALPPTPSATARQDTPTLPRPTATGPTVSASGAGTGLRGDYFADHTFTRLAGSRVDPQIRFDWPGSPIDTVPADRFTVRWSGWIRPGIDGMHTFILRADGGVRLWIDGRLLIDTWERPDISDQPGVVTLEADRLYSLQLDYVDHAGAGEVTLWWQTAGRNREVVPMSRLYPP